MEKIACVHKLEDFNVVNMARYPKLTYKFNAILLSKFQLPFSEMDKLILKFMQTGKKPRVAK